MIADDAVELAKWLQGEDHTVEEITDKLVQTFYPPCPDCGAAWQPRSQWVCGSWQHMGAYQHSVACVAASMQADIDRLNAEIADLENDVGGRGAEIERLEHIITGLGGSFAEPVEQPPVPPPKPVEPEGQIVKEGEPPDAIT